MSSNNRLHNPFSSLPVDIIRLIIEETARISRADAVSLSLVSREFYRWVIPVLYETVLIHGSDEALGDFYFRLTDPSKDVSVSRHVRTIHLLNSVPEQHRDVLHKSLDECSSLQNLSVDPFAIRMLCSSTVDRRSQHELQESSFRPRKLEIYARSPSLPVPFNRPFYEHVTHLHVNIGTIHRIAVLMSMNKFNMPFLTHAAFEMPPSIPWTWGGFTDSMNTILGLESLQLLVLWIPVEIAHEVSPKFPLYIEESGARITNLVYLPDTLQAPLCEASNIIARLRGRFFEPVDPRVVVCKGPLPQKDGYVTSWPEIYRMMPDAIWDWGVDTQKRQKVYLSASSIHARFLANLSIFLIAVLVLGSIFITTCLLIGGIHTLSSY